jgi:hypothetical protein
MSLAFARRACARTLLAVAVASAPFSLAAATATVGLAEAYGRLPMTFEPNRGQAPRDARFIARSGGHGLAIGDDAVAIALASNDARAIVLRFAGARTGALEPEQKLESTSNYFIGNDPSRHLVGVPNFGAVRRHSLYRGIDVRYYGNQRQLEYDLIVAPGADPSQVRLAFEGHEEIEIAANGDLVLRRGGGTLIQRKPVAYQDIGGKRRNIAADYVANSTGTVTLRLGAYDRAARLVIDPVLTYGSHSGGLSSSTSIAVDAAGNAFVAGSVSQSSAFQTVSAFDSSIAHGDVDAFVQKFNATATAFTYSTYLGGGRSIDGAVGIAIDTAGNAYVTGTTNGSDFPTSTTAYQRAPASGGGSWIAKLGPAGNTLAYSTYLLNTTVTGIAVDKNGNAAVTGTATASFATTQGAFQATSHSPTTNAFVFKLNPTGSAAVYSTFLGGSGTDKANGIAVDPSGNAYVAGSTTSTDFPTQNAFRTFFAGGARDAFVTKMNANGTGLAYSTYLGGSDEDYAMAIAVDTRGSAYVTGATASFNFPVLNAFQPQKGGVNVSGTIDNAFVTKLRPDGAALVYSSFLGGNACIGPGGGGCLISRPVDIGTSIAVDPQGNAYVGGQTQSITFPRLYSLNGAVAENGDAAFVTKVSKSGSAILFSTLLNVETGIGSPQSYVKGLAADAAGNVYGTGNIANFQATAGPFQNTTGAIVFKLSSGSQTLTLSSSSNPVTQGQPVAITVNVGNGTLAGGVSLLSNGIAIASATLVNGSATFSLSPSAGIRSLTALYSDANTEIESPFLFQVTNPPSCN